MHSCLWPFPCRRKFNLRCIWDIRIEGVVDCPMAHSVDTGGWVSEQLMHRLLELLERLSSSWCRILRSWLNCGGPLLGSNNGWILTFNEGDKRLVHATLSIPHQSGILACWTRPCGLGWGSGGIRTRPWTSFASRDRNTHRITRRRLVCLKGCLYSDASVASPPLPPSWLNSIWDCNIVERNVCDRGAAVVLPLNSSWHIGVKLMFAQFILPFFIVFVFATFIFAIIPVFALSLAAHFSLGALEWVVCHIIFVIFKLLTLKPAVKLLNLTFVEPCLFPSIMFAVLDLHRSLFTFLLKIGFLLSKHRRVRIVFGLSLLELDPHLVNLLLGSRCKD